MEIKYPRSCKLGNTYFNTILNPLKNWRKVYHYSCQQEFFTMNAKLDQCEKMAMELPLRERARLIEDLVKTLDDIDENECEELWMAEADRRYNEYKKENISAKSSEESVQAVRKNLEILK